MTWSHTGRAHAYVPPLKNSTPLARIQPMTLSEITTKIVYYEALIVHKVAEMRQRSRAQTSSGLAVSGQGQAHVRF
jgi:hypothetical protein